jgi:cytochrome P450
MTANATESETPVSGGCPVTHTDYRVDRPIFDTYAQLNAEREQSDFLLNDSTKDPFYMVQRFEHVLEAMQMPDVFSNDVVNALNPFDIVRFLPNNLNPPDHTRMRKVLNRWFSPAAVRRIEPQVVARAIELIETLAPRGECDFVTEFGIRFPTDMFLMTLGLPASDGAQFVEWVEAIFSGVFGGAAAEKAAAEIIEYFEVAIADRERNPRDPASDFLSQMLIHEAAEDWFTRDDLLTVCMTLITAGLDTTRSALGYIFQHLATHDADRARVNTEPDLLPRMIEEFVRLYTLVIQDGRLVMQDIDFHGLQLKKGDVLWLGIGSANRDPHKFDRPDDFDPDRAELSHHLGFAAGPHRCIGMHLARHEMVITVREWHKRIPDYQVASGTELIERGAQLGLRTLPLHWPVPAAIPTEPRNAVKETS